MSERHRYALIGTGIRHVMFRDAVVSDFSQTCELVGLCDSNPGRLSLSQRQVKDKYGVDVAGYTSAEFTKMIAETSPDCVIVTTKDCTHHDYICRAMEMGCDVITEKPMTIDAEKAKQIFATRQKTGKEVTVTFNYRYAPVRSQVKELLMSGEIGDILSVNFRWLLNRHHGADYFRRWHRHKFNSGGLLVHKSTHHFDLVNWWLGQKPVRVSANGDRRFYTPQTADGLGLQDRGERCHTCPTAAACPFKLDIEKMPIMKEIYLDCEKYDGYHRDQCVFDKDIDIEDNISLTLDYDKGARMTYSLEAYSLWEGYEISFTGTKGTLEHKCEERTYVSGDGTVPAEVMEESNWIKMYPNDASPYDIKPAEAKGGHSGGDPVMLADIFDNENQINDPLKRKANHVGALDSIIVGIAANKSIAQQQHVDIAALARTIANPPINRRKIESLSATSRDDIKLAGRSV
jgi:predicted dehydrogenase